MPRVDARSIPSFMTRLGEADVNLIWLQDPFRYQWFVNRDPWRMQRPRARTPITLFVFLLVVCVRAQGKQKCNLNEPLCFSGPYCVRFENEICENKPRQDCRQETRQDCQTVDETNCVPVTEEICETAPSTEEKCTDADREVCKEVPNKVCTPRTETQCKDVERVDCPEFTKRAECDCHAHHHDKRRLLLCKKNCAIVQQKQTAPCTTKKEKECIVVQKEDCFTNSTTQCDTIKERNCVPLEETSCTTKSTQNCETKPVEKCTDRQEEVCQTVNEQSCRTETDDRFCGDEEEDRLRSLIFNGDVLGVSAVLSDSQDLFSLGAGLTYLPEQNYLIVQSANRSRDPDVVAFQVRHFTNTFVEYVFWCVLVIGFGVVEWYRCDEIGECNFAFCTSRLSLYWSLCCWIWHHCSWLKGGLSW